MEAFVQLATFVCSCTFVNSWRCDLSTGREHRSFNCNPEEGKVPRLPVLVTNCKQLSVKEAGNPDHTPA